MSKRKSRKQRKSRPTSRQRRPRRPSLSLQKTLEQAETMIERGRAEEAIELLELERRSHPRVPDVHNCYGYACIAAGDMPGAMAGYEQAMRLSRDPGYWYPLALIYLELEMNAHALHASRQAARHGPGDEAMDDARRMVALLDREIAELAQALALPQPQVERGLRHLETGNRALQRGDYRACIAANRQAIKLLSDWPPPRNNLSLALFFDGQAKDAISMARQVLSQTPDNLQALSNAIRFLVWTGQETEARGLWPRLKAIEPEDASGRLKMAEAAAVLHEDERVYELLRPLDRSEAMQGATPGYGRGLQLFLAVAEANLGRRGARARLKRLEESVSWAGEMLQALEAGRPGPGWAERFPYFHSTELVPKRLMEAWIDLASRQERMSPKRFRQQMDRFVSRVPQIVLAAEKLIWEEDQPEAGIGMLKIVGTPAAYAALRRFGLSRAGDDEWRMQALYALLEKGQIGQDDTVRFWGEGEWREVQLRLYEISDEPRSEYTPRVADLLQLGLQALKQGDDEGAEQSFRRVLALEPRAKEAYNNLGTIYARRGDHGQAREMFQAALDIDPLYVLPRCNLATYLLDDDDVEGATAMLSPLADVTHFHPQDMAFYSYLQARISIHQEDYEAARNALEAALEIWPGYELAENLLERLQMTSTIRTRFGSFFERQRKRDRAKRARLQAKLTTRAPSLAEALPLYSREVLTGMARVILPYGGWSGLRKAELLEKVVEELKGAGTVERLVAQLSETEREALQQVLAGGGHMPWQSFDARFGNDLEESQYWQYHEPKTTMGRLRFHGLLVETTVNDELLVAVPSELRQALGESLTGA